MLSAWPASLAVSAARLGFAVPPRGNRRVEPLVVAPAGLRCALGGRAGDACVLRGKGMRLEEMAGCGRGVGRDAPLPRGGSTASRWRRWAGNGTMSSQRQNGGRAGAAVPQDGGGRERLGREGERGGWPRLPWGGGRILHSDVTGRGAGIGRSQ